MLTTQVTQMGNGYDSTRKRNGLRQDMLRLLSKAFKCIDFEKQMLGDIILVWKSSQVLNTE